MQWSYWESTPAYLRQALAGGVVCVLLRRYTVYDLLRTYLVVSGGGDIDWAVKLAAATLNLSQADSLPIWQQRANALRAET